MKRMLLVLAVAALVVAPVSAQQPNSPTASAVWAGTDGPPFPISVTWNSLAIAFDVSGSANQPYLVARAPALVPGAGFNLGAPGILDIDITLGFQFVMDGFGQSTGTFLDLLANTGPTGLSAWTFPISSNGNLGAFQAAVGDPSNPGAGFTLTAASDVTVQAAQNLIFTGGGGDDTTGTIATAFGTTDFYDVNYTQLNICSNGNISLSGVDNSFTPTLATFLSGTSRIAPLWTDMIFGATLGGAPLVGNFVEDTSGWQFTWVLMRNYFNQSGPMTGTIDNTGPTNTFTVLYDNSTGQVTFDFGLGSTAFAVPANVHADWGISGITPGGGLGNGGTIMDYQVDPVASGGIGIASSAVLEDFFTNTENGLFPAAFLTTNGTQVNFLPTAFSGGLGVANSYVMF